jgi:hypothetical protein
MLFEELAYGAFSRLLRDAHDEAAPASHGARRKKTPAGLFAGEWAVRAAPELLLRF